jgi:hypothetical protein
MHVLPILRYTDPRSKNRNCETVKHLRKRCSRTGKKFLNQSTKFVLLFKCEKIIRPNLLESVDVLLLIEFTICLTGIHYMEQHSICLV